MSTAILWPTFALVALVFVVLITMAAKRFSFMKTTPPQRDNFTSAEAQKAYFTPVDSPAANLANLFEMPVLYFALIPLLLLFRHANHIQVGLAWAFMLLRMIHSFVHVGRKGVRPRFLAYFLSCLVLSVMWVGFAVDMAATLGSPALR